METIRSDSERETIRDSRREIIRSHSIKEDSELEEISDVMFAMLASEEVLAEAWNTPEEDETWKDL